MRAFTSGCLNFIAKSKLVVIRGTKRRQLPFGETSPGDRNTGYIIHTIMCNTNTYIYIYIYICRVSFG